MHSGSNPAATTLYQEKPTLILVAKCLYCAHHTSKLPILKEAGDDFGIPATSLASNWYY